MGCSPSAAHYRHPPSRMNPVVIGLRLLKHMLHPEPARERGFTFLSSNR